MTDKDSILLNTERFKQQSPHGLVLGDKGAGVNCVVKREIASVLRNPNVCVLMIDLFGDYADFCISNNGQHTIVAPYKYYKSAVSKKEMMAEEEKYHLTFFVETLASVLLNKELTPCQTSFIDRCTKELEYLPLLSELPSILKNKCECRCEREMANAFDILEENTFQSLLVLLQKEKSFQFNVFDLKCVEPQLKEAAYLVLLEHFYQIMKENSKHGIPTFVYVPFLGECVKNEYVHSYLSHLVKISRRLWGGFSFAEYDASVFIKNNYLRNIACNVSHVCLLKQRNPNKEILQALFGLQEENISYLNTATDNQAVIIKNGKEFVIL